MQTAVVNQVLSLAHQAVKESHRDRLESYIRTYCRAIPPEVLSEVEPHKLLAFVMDRFAFLEEDFGRTVKVEIRDAENTLTTDETPSTVIETRLPDCGFIIRTIKSFLRQMEQMQRLTRIRDLSLKSKRGAPGEVEVQVALAIYFAEG